MYKSTNDDDDDDDDDAAADADGDDADADNNSSFSPDTGIHYRQSTISAIPRNGCDR